MNDLVLLEQNEQIVTITINRPEKRNALDWHVMQALDDAFAKVETLENVRVVLLRAEGKAFSAGIDLMGFEALAESFGENWRDNLFHVTAAMQAVVNRVERLSYPVIALLHGYCIGLGLELALACDFRIAAEGTRLQLPETRIGLVPDVGGTTRLTRVLGVARAKEYIMTGRAFDLADAERWGLVNYVVPEAELLNKGQSLAEELCEAAPLAVSYAKKVIDGISDLDRGFQMEAWAQSILMRSDDFMTGAQAAMLKQKPEWQGK